MRKGGALFLATCLAGACHVWSSLDVCNRDGDCPSDLRCDMAEHWCIRTPRADVPEAGTTDAASETPPPMPACDKDKAFGPPVRVGGFDGQPLISARLNRDETAVFYSRLVTGATRHYDVYTAARKTRNEPFSSGAPLSVVNSSLNEYWPTVNREATLLFFESERSLSRADGSAYVADVARIWSSVRQPGAIDFDEPRLLGAFALPGGGDTAPYLHPDGHALYFASLGRSGQGNQDIFVADISSLGLVTAVRSISEVSSAGLDSMPVVSLDETRLYFARADDQDESRRNIFMARRASANATFGTPTPVAELNTNGDEFPSWISDDDCRLYWISNRDVDAADEYHLWVSERPR